MSSCKVFRHTLFLILISPYCSGNEPTTPCEQLSEAAFISGLHQALSQNIDNFYDENYALLKKSEYSDKISRDISSFVRDNHLSINPMINSILFKDYFEMLCENEKNGTPTMSIHTYKNCFSKIHLKMIISENELKKARQCVNETR